jgi:hypothetical protein
MQLSTVISVFGGTGKAVSDDSAEQSSHLDSQRAKSAVCIDIRLPKTIIFAYYADLSRLGEASRIRVIKKSPLNLLRN